MQIERDQNRSLVYGIVNQGLVLMSEEKARELAALHDALRTAQTWNEFKERVSSERYRDVLERLDENDPEEDDIVFEPQPDEKFDREAIFGYADGDWPEWPAQEMLAWVPEDIQARFGKCISSTLNGEFLFIEPASIPDVVAALEAQGYMCREDQALVERTSG